MSTFFKRCLDCKVCYRYQEHDLGIHIFNDTFLINFDVCDVLRDVLQQHLPTGSIVKVWESRIGKQLNSQLVVTAHLHFDRLSEQSYDCDCSFCGYHSVTLIYDLNRKVTFVCLMADLQITDDYDEDEADYLNVEKFWRKVKLCMIARGFPGLEDKHQYDTIQYNTIIYLESITSGKVALTPEPRAHVENVRLYKNNYNILYTIQ